jgi:spore coat polysaccharide biosynthesis protein SpsF (cytidylyltransferase family)/sialic acid synthase SpsE
METMQEFSDFSGGFGMKFQPFKFDQIALPSFRSFELYKKLFFTEQQWREIISKCRETKDVWIDIFDEYTCKIVEENLPSVYGIKFQSSVLYNSVVVGLLSKLDLSGKKVIINISGIELSELAGLINTFESLLAPEELILQIGFQAYPTELADSGLSKIPLLKTNFPKYRISFADHIAADELDAIFAPVIAFSMGATIIEKHICKSGEKPQYDHFSSLNREYFDRFYDSILVYSESLNSDYINTREANYLERSIQIPVLNKDLKAGQIISTDSDLNFRRSGEPGLGADELIKLIHNEHYILGNDKKKDETIKIEDLKKPVIGVVIGGRLKSKRLPGKLLKSIGSITAVEACIRGALRFKEANHVILATSNLEEDAPLANYTYSEQVKFVTGEPDDLLARFITTIDEFDLDIVVRATADCPFLSDEVFEHTLNSHFRKGADVSRPLDFAVGTNMSVGNTQAYRKVREYFPNPKMSEYLIYYFVNNPKHFRINILTLPQELIRNYRLTLDYPEDLELIDNIEKHLNENKLEPSATNIFNYLDENPQLSDINRNRTLVYESDNELIERIRKDSTLET